MSTYAIGDIQGCYSGLREILAKVNFDPTNDQLYSVGDLVARGEDSLNTMLYLMDLGESFDTVLGNHDLHLISIAHGLKQPKPHDYLDRLIYHPSFSRIIDWLLTKPVALHIEPDTLIVHAGLHPKWSIKQLLQYSTIIQKQMQSGERILEFLTNMYGNTPDKWEAHLNEQEALRFIINATTRMRFLTKDLRLEHQTKCHPDDAPKDLIPWFNFNNSKLKPKHRIIFGHWASLNGLNKTHHLSEAKLIGLDTGYVWGNSLTMYNLESEEFFQHQAFN